MPIATNPETGEVVYLTDDGRWEKSQTAINPQTKQTLAFDGKNWIDAPKMDRGTLDATARGVAQGASAGFYDELRGLVEAGGAKSNDPASLYKLIGGAYKYWTGDKAAEDQYNKTAQREREVTKTAESQHPYASIGGNVAGSLALPIGGMAGGATMAARMGRGAAIGFGYGALAGLGEGEGASDSLSRAATGAVLGGALGGAAAPVVEGVLQAGRVAVNPAISAVRSALDREGEAARRVVDAIRRDGNVDVNAIQRMTPQEFINTPQAGLVDLGGEAARALARSAANTSPEGRMALSQHLDDRYQGQTNRVTEWLNQNFHFPDAVARQEALDQTSRAANNANYQRAYRDGANGIGSPELERLAGSDAVGAAMRRAASKAGDESIIGGYGAMNPRVTFTPDGRVVFNRAPNGVPAYPDLQFWDLTRRELSDAAIQAGHGTSEARRLQSFARTMNTELDRLVPSYRAAREGAAAAFGAENALEAGQNFVTMKMGNREAQRQMARMSPQERQLFQDGFVSRFVDSLREVGDTRNVLNKIAESPAARERLNMVLGQQRATEMEAMLRIEGLMNLPRQATQGNSTTARQWAELGLAGGAVSYGGVSTYNMDPTHMTIAAVSAGLLAGRRHIDQRVAQRVAEMLVSRDPEVFRRGVATVARNRTMMEGLRATDRRLALAGGQQTPIGLAGPQMPAAGRADDQPEVPRPRSQ